MSKEKTEQLVKSILTKDSASASEALQSVLNDKYEAAIEAKKISVASKLYSNK
jgi:hypothetical protein